VSEVIDLSLVREARKPENQYCYECGCGGQRFMLRPDAKIQCCECSDIKPRLIWGQFFVSESINPPDQSA
jgi:hypothetical protein